MELMVQNRTNLEVIWVLCSTLRLRLVVLQLGLDLCKDPRRLSPPVVRWQRGET